MKKFVTVLGLSVLTMFATQGAYANNAEKIEVVKAMFNYELDTNAHYDDRGFTKFLSKDFQKTIIRQKEYDDIHQDGGDIDFCETEGGGLIVFGGDSDPKWQKRAKNTAKYTITKQGYVQIRFKYSDESQNTVNFRLIKENGKWKVDDLGSNGHWWKKSTNECLNKYG